MDIRKMLSLNRFVKSPGKEHPEMKLLEKYRGTTIKSSEDKNDAGLRDIEIIVLDTETTGLKPHTGDEIISMGACLIKGGELTDQRFHRLVNPMRPIPNLITDLTGISDEMVAVAESFYAVVTDLLDFIGNRIIVGHCIDFDINFLNYKLKKSNVKIGNYLIDTCILSKVLLPDLKVHTLDSILSHLGFYPEGRHSALGDAILTTNVLLYFIKELDKKGIKTLCDLKYYIYNAILYKL
ncbi:MAG: PolC-type DNA polymerase III [Bacillota bacterium]